MNKVFENSYIGNLKLKNRIIRSATYEGMADEKGVISNDYIEFYESLSKEDIGGIITGFSFISKEGRAMHRGQSGIDTADKIPTLTNMIKRVHENNGVIFQQIAHTGRQSKEYATGGKLKSSSSRRSLYFLDKPEALSDIEIGKIIKEFGTSAKYSKEAGFDGVQLHCAHGYLIHQFITPAINKRDDCWGINKKSGIGDRFLQEIIKEVRIQCGTDFPILVKVSGSDDFRKKFRREQFISLIKILDELNVHGIEISYGTMDYALNIFRGESIPVETILKYNPIYKTDNKFLKKIWKIFVYPILKRKIIEFSPMYNLDYAKIAKENTKIPIIVVGGFRKLEEINYAVNDLNMDFVSLCRPFLREKDIITKYKEVHNYTSKCINCNCCVILVDSGKATKCIYSK